MGQIADIEDAIIAKVEATLGNTVKEVVTIQGGWTLDMLKRALQRAPSVYVAFLGGKRGIDEGYINGKFAVYIVTKAAIETARRRGTAREIGAYDIIELLTPVLDGMEVTDIGNLSQQSIDNLFRDAMFDLGGTVYGLMFEVANMPMSFEADLTTLTDFVKFRAEHSLAPGPDEPAAVDEVTL